MKSTMPDSQTTALLIFVIPSVWIMAGAWVCLCAIEFLGAKPSLAKIIVALVAGPFSLKGKWWGVK